MLSHRLKSRAGMRAGPSLDVVQIMHSTDNLSGAAVPAPPEQEDLQEWGWKLLEFITATNTSVLNYYTTVLLS